MSPVIKRFCSITPGKVFAQYRLVNKQSRSKRFLSDVKTYMNPLWTCNRRKSIRGNPSAEIRGFPRMDFCTRVWMFLLRDVWSIRAAIIPKIWPSRIFSLLMRSKMMKHVRTTTTKWNNSTTGKIGNNSKYLVMLDRALGTLPCYFLHSHA